MEPLNFCRDMRAEFKRALERVKGKKLDKDDATTATLVRRSIELTDKAQKFLLPYNGIVCDDPDFKALIATNAIKLPFPVIAVEFECVDEHGDEQKRITFYEETGDAFRITPLIYSSKDHSWATCGHANIKIDVASLMTKDKYFDIMPNIETVNLIHSGVIRSEKVHAAYGSDLMIMLSLLNVLACSNIERSQIQTPREPKGFKKIAPLPFDSYWVLHVGAHNKSLPGGGTHRSPREHVRRGHVRRLHNGKAIWINSMIVARGSAGKVTKDYAV